MILSNSQSYKSRIVAGAFWLLTGGLGRNAINLILYLGLSHILSPSDFGAVAIVVSIISILQIFAELGTSVALVQMKTIDQSIKDCAFVVTIAVTGLFVLILWASAPAIAHFFENELLVELIRIAAFSYSFLGIFSLYRSLLLRELRYKTISIIEFIGSLLSLILSIFLAFLDYGPSSVVWGQLGSAVFLFICGCFCTRVFPKSLGNWLGMRKLFSFGVWVSISRVLGNASGQFDKLIIGKLLDSGTLGGYYLAQKIVMVFPSIFTSVIDQVMLPIYSRWQDNPSRIENGYWMGLRISSLIVLPSMVLVAAMAHPLVSLLLGDKWIYIVPIIRVLCLFGAIQGLGGGIFGSVIYASGKPQVMLIVNCYRIVMLPLCIFLGSFWGVLGISYGMVVFGFTGRLFNQYILKRMFGFKFLPFFKILFFPVVINVLLFVFLVVVSFIVRNEVYIVLTSTLSFCLLYVFLLKKFYFDDFTYIKKCVLKR